MADHASRCRRGRTRTGARSRAVIWIEPDPRLFFTLVPEVYAIEGIPYDEPAPRRGELDVQAGLGDGAPARPLPRRAAELGRAEGLEALHLEVACTNTRVHRPCHRTGFRDQGRTAWLG